MQLYEIIIFTLYHVIVRPTKIIKDCCKASTLNAIYVLALQRSLIILVGLTMTCFSEKMMISYSFIRGFMPNLHKQSWMVSVYHARSRVLAFYDFEKGKSFRKERAWFLMLSATTVASKHIGSCFSSTTKSVSLASTQFGFPGLLDSSSTTCLPHDSDYVYLSWHMNQGHVGTTGSAAMRRAPHLRH